MWFTLEECAIALETSTEQAVEQMGKSVRRRPHLEFGTWLYRAEDVFMVKASFEACSVDGCRAPARIRGMCKLHYFRDYREKTA